MGRCAPAQPPAQPPAMAELGPRHCAGLKCHDAHGAQELRLEAAVAAGLLPADYKCAAQRPRPPRNVRPGCVRAYMHGWQCSSRSCSPSHTVPVKPAVALLHQMVLVCTQGAEAGLLGAHRKAVD